MKTEFRKSYNLVSSRSHARARKQEQENLTNRQIGLTLHDAGLTAWCL